MTEHYFTDKVVITLHIMRERTKQPHYFQRKGKISNGKISKHNKKKRNV